MEDIRALLWNRFYGFRTKPYRDYYKVNENELVPSYDNTYDESKPVYRKIQDTEPFFHHNRSFGSLLC